MLKKQKLDFTRLIWTGATYLFLFSHIVAAHGEVHELIDVLSAQIEKSPANATLYLERGELYRVHHNYTEAGADFETAARLQPTLIVVDFFRGELCFDIGKFADAIVALDKYLAQKPREYRALSTRGKAHAKLLQFDRAIADFDAALAFSPTPAPELYIDRIRALEGGRGAEAAIEGVNAAILKLGDVSNFHLLGIDFEVKLKRYDAALKRVEILAAQSPRKERWLLLKAEILLSAGEIADAKSALCSALSNIEALPSFRRQTTATIELENKIKTTLAALAAR